METKIGMLDMRAMEFLSEHAPERYREGDITIDAAAETWAPLGRIQVARKLDKLVKSGKLEKVVGVLLPSGKAGNVYRIVETYPREKK